MSIKLPTLPIDCPNCGEITPACECGCYSDPVMREFPKNEDFVWVYVKGNPRVESRRTKHVR